MERDEREPTPPVERGEARPTRRRLIVATACSAAAFAVGGGLAALALRNDEVEPKKRPSVATAPIERGTLQGTSTVSGTLAFGGSRGISTGTGGVVTALRTPGAIVRLGESLYALDNRPTYLMYGPLPVWRSFESGMPDGPDIRALAASLAALGYFDREPDETFEWSTRAAIQRWQKATGQEQSGSIPLGRIEFAAGEVRVSTLDAAVGDRTGPGSALITVTDTTKIVNANLKLTDQQLASVGGKVAISLPNGASTSGSVASVGVPTEKDGSGGRTEVVIPVVITLDDPAAAGEFQQAGVTARFPSERRENVLSVPVGALLALDGSRFGVELVRADGTTKRVAVTTGLFAAGRVEVSGSGLRHGQKVVVPTL